MNTSRYLRDHDWYDKYTRAIFIEFTVYNANVNLFSVVTLLVETPTFGGGVPSHLVHTFRLYQYSGGLLIVAVAFQVSTEQLIIAHPAILRFIPAIYSHHLYFPNYPDMTVMKASGL